MEVLPMDAENLQGPSEDQWIEKYRAAIAVMPVEISRMEQVRKAFVHVRSLAVTQLESIAGNMVDYILDQWTRTNAPSKSSSVHTMPVRSSPLPTHMTPSPVADELAKRKTG
jgi:hypothetical protein